MKVHQFVTCVKSSLEVLCDVRGAVSLEKLSHSLVRGYRLIQTGLAYGIIGALEGGV